MFSMKRAKEPVAQGEQTDKEKTEKKKEKKAKKRRLSHTCEHLEDFKAKEGLKIYNKIHTNFIAILFDRSKELKIEAGKCNYCGKFDGLVNSCLHCVTFSCLKEGHTLKHYKETNHPLSCYLGNGAIYCFKCADFVYDKQIDLVAHTNEQISALVHMIPQTTHFRGGPIMEKLRKYSTSASFNGGNKPVCISADSTYGLRGLINLGHTCFLNAIVQALIHTPMLRDFFLTEAVSCNEMHDSKKEKPCIAPLFFKLFQDFHNGSKTPMSLHDLLYRMWVNAAHVSGYDQQDAHEFFMAMVQALHEHFILKKGENNIIDLLFLGNLESSVTCKVCGQKSITVDPIWDTSLNLVTENTPVTSTQPTPKETADMTPITLDECLDRYCQKEYLQGSESIFCANCLCNQNSTKQLKFKKVPVILLLHLKRFKHRGQSQKIDNPVKFPERLDMTPYTSGHDENRVIPKMHKFAHQSRNSENRYVLYAVVNHMGNFDGGHFHAFVKQNNCWFLCDDSNITKVELETVLNSPGYLLFYHRESVFSDIDLKSLDAKHSNHKK